MRTLLNPLDYDTRGLSTETGTKKSSSHQILMLTEVLVSLSCSNRKNEGCCFQHRNVVLQQGDQRVEHGVTQPARPRPGEKQSFNLHRATWADATRHCNSLSKKKCLGLNGIKINISFKYVHQNITFFSWGEKHQKPFHRFINIHIKWGGRGILLPHRRSF